MILALVHGDAPSLVDAHGRGARIAARELWIQFGAAAFVFALVAGILVAIVIRGREPARGIEHGERPGTAWVLGGGVLLPLVVVTFLFVLSARDVSRIDSPAAKATVAVEVTGHRWWWEVRYPGLGIATANELALPVGGTAIVSLTSADVIHSFSVSQLQPKQDAIPGMRSTLTITPTRAGIYRGVCAEFCGLEHAKMHFLVEVMPPGRFAAWLRQMRAPARPPETQAEREGLRLVETAGCQTCHTIRGTKAGGTFGPDLTHVGSRPALVGAQLPNTPGNLAGWIADPQDVKPGAEMPAIRLSGVQLRSIVAYLESLR
jgi:cytochrome c oxidase subunit 2